MKVFRRWLSVAALPAPTIGASSQCLPAETIFYDTYQDLAQHGLHTAALGAFYAYESQVPRISEEKLTGLKGYYGADEPTCEYFPLHMTADLHHAKVWRTLLDRSVEQSGAHADQALDGACQAAKALWRALDGIENARCRLVN